MKELPVTKESRSADIKAFKIEEDEGVRRVEWNSQDVTRFELNVARRVILISQLVDRTSLSINRSALEASFDIKLK